MNYKLLNWVFGWDYIYWSNSAAQGVARVYRDAEGSVYYWRYKITQLADPIEKPSDVMWLTCPSSKYFTETAES
jgi:hypothetical protein